MKQHEPSDIKKSLQVVSATEMAFRYLVIIQKRVTLHVTKCANGNFWLTSFSRSLEVLQFGDLDQLCHVVNYVCVFVKNYTAGNFDCIKT